MVLAALREIEEQGRQVQAVVFLGGTEKIDDVKLGERAEFFNFPLLTHPNPLEAIRMALAKYQVDQVVDLSDEPVVGYEERFNIASLVLSHGVEYIGADFAFSPPEFYAVSKQPSLSIIGTGKRVGKTAVSAWICRVLKAHNFQPAVIAMGRGGPDEPEIVLGDEVELTPAYLLSLAKKGKHAASDYYEDALMSRIPTVGCRRCGGGMAGKPFLSNVLEGARKANTLKANFLVFEGSGATIPPVKTNARIVVVDVNQRPDYITGFFGAYRLLISDLLIFTNCDANAAIDELEKSVKKIKSDIIAVRTVFRPKPLGDIKNKKVFLATTALRTANQRIISYLENQFSAKVVGVSNSLAKRKLLREDLQRAQQADVILTELKAAAVDVVTDIGLSLGKQVIYYDNEPKSLPGINLEQIIVDLAQRAVKNWQTAQAKL